MLTQFPKIAMRLVRKSAGARRRSPRRLFSARDNYVMRLSQVQLLLSRCHILQRFPPRLLTMRLAHRLLMATPASIGSKSSLTEALALLPPLQLYRRLLRVHRKLDPEMRVLGDSYVKKEFRAHRNAENPLHIVCLDTRLPGLPCKLDWHEGTGGGRTITADNDNGRLDS